MGQSTEELTREIRATRQSLSRDVDELSDKVSPSRVVQRQTEAAKTKLGSIRDQVMGTAAETTEAVTDKASSAAGTVQDTAHSVARSAQGHPLAAGLAAFGVGMVISALIPATKQESQVAQRAVDTAKEYGAPVLAEGADHLKEAALVAAQELKGSAQEAAAHVSDEAGSAIDTVAGDAQEAASTVSTTAQDRGAPQL